MFQPAFINSTASSALRPRQGAPAACALVPRKRNSALMSAIWPDCPHDTFRSLLTCEKITASTSLNIPSRT